MSSDLTSWWLKWKKKHELRLNSYPNWKWTELASVSNKWCIIDGRAQKEMRSPLFDTISKLRQSCRIKLSWKNMSKACMSRPASQPAWFYTASLKLNVKWLSPLKGLWSSPVCLCVRACSPLKMGLLYEFRKAFTAALSGGYSAP